MMVPVYLGIGSNVEREKNVASCLDHLRRHFGALTISSTYQCKSVGFEGDDFFNLAVGVESDLPPHDLVAVLHEIEAKHGRDRARSKFTDRTLDIDLLLYGDLVLDDPGLVLPRAEILENAFVLKPLAEIAPQLMHPVEHKTIGKLWAAFEQPADDVLAIT